MTVSAGAIGGGFGIAGISLAVGASSSDSSPASAVTTLASTGAGHIADLIAAGAILVTAGLVLLGFVRRQHEPTEDDGAAAISDDVDPRLELSSSDPA